MTEHLGGRMTAGGEDLGPCRLALHRDPFAPNDMRAEVFGLQDLPDTPEAVVRDADGGESVEVTLNLELASGSFGAEPVFRAPVTRVDERRQFDARPPEQLTVDAVFPLTSLTSHTSPLHTSSLGTTRLTDFFDPRWRAASDEPFEVETAHGTLELGEAVVAHSGADGPHQSSLLVRHSYARLVLAVEGGGEGDRAERAFDDLFACISLCESDRVLPYATRTIAVGDGRLVSTRTVTRWTPPPSASYRPGPYPSAPRRQTLQRLVAALATLDPSARADFDRMAHNFSVASTTPVLEFELIHWHSCLDVLIKSLGSKPPKGRTGFSSKLVDLCDRLALAVDDLLGPLGLKAIRANGNQAPAFPFTRLRNNYIHDGFDAFEGHYDDAIRYIRILRALAERLLLHSIGADYRSTHLGTDRV